MPRPSLHADSRVDWNRSYSSLLSLQPVIDVVDHSKLSRAWDEILTPRCITASMTSVSRCYCYRFTPRPFSRTSVFYLPPKVLLVLALRFTWSRQYCPQEAFDPEPFRHLKHAAVKDDAGPSMTWMVKHLRTLFPPTRKCIWCVWLPSLPVAKMPFGAHTTSCAVKMADPLVQMTRWFSVRRSSQPPHLAIGM